jgi:hypothetical protein
MPQSLSQLYIHHTPRNPPPRGQFSRGIPEAAGRARNRLRRAVRVRLKRIVAPLQGSGIGLGPIDPGLRPELRYFAPLGLTCPHLSLAERENRVRAEALKTCVSLLRGEKVAEERRRMRGHLRRRRAPRCAAGRRHKEALFSFSQGRRWTATGVLTSRRGPDEGSLAPRALWSAAAKLPLSAPPGKKLRLFAISAERRSAEG